MTSFSLWSQTKSWFFAFFLLLRAHCIPLLVVCHLYFLYFIFFLFWWLITVHWSSFTKWIYLHLHGSELLHDETKIWRCNPNHRQSILPAFHKSLAKYDDYFTEGSCSRCQNFQFGNQMVFGNMWTLQCSWLPTHWESWRNVNPIKIRFSWISTKRETSMLREIQTFCGCRVSAESMSSKKRMSGGNYSMSAKCCRENPALLASLSILLQDWQMFASMCKSMKPYWTYTFHLWSSPCMGCWSVIWPYTVHDCVCGNYEWRQMLEIELGKGSFPFVGLL